MHSVCKTSVSGNDRQEDGWFISTAFKMRFQPFSFIPFVHEQPELYARPICPETIGRICNPLYVEGICPSDSHRQQESVGVSHQTTFYTLFPPVCGVPACFF